jgi:uncharacterized repeat protein (TIGR01451 family)
MFHFPVSNRSNEVLATDAAGSPGDTRRLSLRIGLLLTITFVVLAIGGAGTAAAAPAVSGCTTVNSSGTYTLTGNITAPADQPCLVVEADDVVLDGNGYIIEGNGSGGVDGYPVTAENVSNLTVENVRIANWSQPVRLTNVTDATVRNVVIRDGSATYPVPATGLQIQGGVNHTVVDSRIVRMPLFGIDLTDARRTEISRTNITESGDDGLLIWDGGNHTVSQSELRDNGHHGIDAGAGADNLTIRNSTIRDNGRKGVSLARPDDSRITGNTIVASTDHGVDAFDLQNITVSDNTVRASGQAGIRLQDSTNSIVRNNTVEDNNNQGIVVLNRGDSLFRSNALIAANTVRRNGENGITLGGVRNVTVRNNVVRNHTDPDTLQGAALELGGTGVWVVANTFRDNDAGIVTTSQADTSSGIITSNEIELNSIVNNTYYGIIVDDGIPIELFEVRNNVIERNGQFGIWNRNDTGDVSATDNWWGDPSGPSSNPFVPRNVTDPVTGAVANGTGDAVSADSSTSDVANVRFDPWLRTQPIVDGFVIVTERLVLSELNRPVTHRIVTRGETPPITSFEVVNGSLPPGMDLDDDGLLSGTPIAAGNFTFTVRATDSDGETANATFTKRVAATVPRPDIEIHKAGSRATAGRETLYAIQVTNTGSTIARNVSVDEYLQPWFTYAAATPKPDNLTTAVVRNGTAEEIEAVTTYNGSQVDLENDLTKTTIRWTIEKLRPGESRILTYQARLEETAPTGMSVTGEACVSKGPCGKKFKSCKQEVTSKCNVSNILGKADQVASCLKPSPAGCVMGFFSQTTNLCKKAGTALVCESAYKTCRQQSPNAIPVDPPCDDDSKDVTAPKDPNDKLVAADRYVQSSDRLPYTVRFENIGNATARDVFVTDRLPDSLNRSTLEVFDTNGTHRALTDAGNVTLLNQTKNRTKTVIINGTKVIVNETVVEQHNASLDGRTVTWHLENIGLEPNETGRVVLSVAPDPTLASGTRIENNATIRFDNVSTLTTNNTVNVIDDTPPSCTVDPLPDRSPRLVPLSWSGTDSVGEIESATLMVSNDSGTWRVVDVGLESRNTTFGGSLGESYEFMCVAEDTAGNTETQSPTAEASTAIPAVSIDGTVQTADGTPAANHTVSIADAADVNVTGGIVAREGTVVCGLTEFNQVGTDNTGRYALVSDVAVRKDLAYYQAPSGAFLRGDGADPPAAATFPKDGSPDLYALDRFTPSNDTTRATTTLPAAETLNVTVQTEAGVPVENATVVFDHTGVNGSRATVAFPNGTTADGVFEPNEAVGPGFELNGSVGVKVLPPNDEVYLAQAYRQETTVTEDETLTVQVAAQTPIAAYATSDGVVETGGLLQAINDWRADQIDTLLLLDVIDAWRSGDPVL